MAADKPRVLGVLVSTLAIGGAEQLLLELCRRLDQSRFTPRLYCLGALGPIGQELAALGIPVRAGLGGGAGSILRLTRVFRQDRPEVLLLINHRNCLFYGVPAARLAGVPVVVNWQNETYKRHPCHEVYMFLRRAIVWGLDALVAASRGHAGYLVGVEGIPVRKIAAIPNSVDCQAFCPTLGSDAAKERLGIPTGCHTAGILAALRPDKAHDVFLQAAALVVAADPATHFVIIGDGPQRPFLEALVARLGLGGHVTFLGFRRDLATVLPALDVAVLSSHPQQETLSVAALEAMAAGIPVISTRVGFMDEIVLEGETGCLVPPGNPPALAAAMLELLGDDAKRLEMGRAACRLVREGHCLEGMARRFEALFDELLAGRSPRERLCQLAERRIALALTWAEEGRWQMIDTLRRHLAAVEIIRFDARGQQRLSRLGRASAWTRAVLLAGLTFWRSWRFDVVLSWSITPGVCLGLLLRLLPARWRPVHVIRDFHLDLSRPGLGYRLRLALLRLALPGIDVLWCTSEPERATYAALLGRPLEATAFYPDEPPSQFLDRPDTPPGDYVFAYGNSDRDFGSLLAIADKVGREIVILSQACAFPEQLPDGVRLIRSRVSEEALIALIEGAAVVVVPTGNRTLAAGQNVLLEAMALGRAVVAAANVAVCAYCEPGEGVLFYEPGDRAGLLAQLQSLLNNPQQARAMGQRGRERARELLAAQPGLFLELVARALKQAGK
ncbi:glycosyltransferase [Desulfovibrio aerotolerans]|uniref:Glycosyltransferase n=1 Tax=Solidesulfovibrio aerotolerans TaxID=295255 RepID=A0A7C9IUC2_9BACT|nr:glycosyltransferase [Solidesulfovibrio aerotolerans]MYL82323.1 glycosyltransferase [Solidesulfovibrio aerotolerans]